MSAALSPRQAERILHLAIAYGRMQYEVATPSGTRTIEQRCKLRDEAFAKLERELKSHTTPKASHDH